MPASGLYMAYMAMSFALGVPFGLVAYVLGRGGMQTAPRGRRVGFWLCGAAVLQCVLFAVGFLAAGLAIWVMNRPV